MQGGVRKKEVQHGHIILTLEKLTVKKKEKRKGWIQNQERS